MRLSPFRPAPDSMRPPEARGKRERRGRRATLAPRNTRNSRLPAAILALRRAARVKSRGERRRSARRRRAMLSGNVGDGSGDRDGMGSAGGRGGGGRRSGGRLARRRADVPAFGDGHSFPGIARGAGLAAPPPADAFTRPPPAAPPGAPTPRGQHPSATPRGRGDRRGGFRAGFLSPPPLC